MIYTDILDMILDKVNPGIIVNLGVPPQMVMSSAIEMVPSTNQAAERHAAPGVRLGCNVGGMELKCC